jgi:hypothetical protein
VATLAQIRAGIKTTLEAAIPDLHVYPHIVSVQRLPAVVVYPADADYRQVMRRAHMEWPLDLYVLCSAAEDTLGQYELDELIDITGPRSVVEALFGEDLGLDGTQTHVATMTRYGGRFDSAGVDHVGAVLRLTVHTPGATS